MTLIINADRVRETTSTTGTGTLTRTGADGNYRTFGAAIGDGNTCFYCAYNDTNSEWEVGLGTVASGTFARTEVLWSSNSNALVSFTAAPKVMCVSPAEINPHPANNSLLNGGGRFAQRGT